MGDGEEGEVFDIRVVFGSIRDDVVDIVIVLPPAEGESSYEIGKEHPDKGIDVVVMCYSHVARIVNSEDQLMPEVAKASSAQHVPFPAKECEAKDH